MKLQEDQSPESVEAAYDVLKFYLNHSRDVQNTVK